MLYDNVKNSLLIIAGGRKKINMWTTTYYFGGANAERLVFATRISIIYR